MGKIVQIKDARINFPFLFQKNIYKGKGSYRAEFCVLKDSPTDILIKKAIQEVGKEAFGAKWDNIFKAIENNAGKLSYRDGSTKNKPEYMLLVASSKRQVPVYFPNKVKATIDNDPITSGCYVNGVVDIYADKGNAGVFCSLAGVQFVKEGEPFGGGYIANDADFEELTDDILA